MRTLMRDEQGAVNRARFADGAFARELARLDGGTPPSRVIIALSKGSERDHAWGKDLKRLLEHGLIAKGEVSESRVRHVDSAEARRLLAFVLRLLGLMQRGSGKRASEIRVDGPDGFWGRTELDNNRGGRRASKSGTAELPHPLVFDAPSGHFRFHDAPPRSYRQRAKRERTYCPLGKTGGLAARHNVTTRTIGNWARLLRVAGFIGCKQPPRKAEDAWLSRRQGDYPYGVWRILRTLPAKVMQRLRLVWGELRPHPESTFEQLLVAGRPADRSSVEDAPWRPPKGLSELARERRRGKEAARELPPTSR